MDCVYRRWAATRDGQWDAMISAAGQTGGERLWWGMEELIERSLELFSDSEEVNSKCESVSWLGVGLAGVFHIGVKLLGSRGSEVGSVARLPLTCQMNTTGTIGWRRSRRKSFSRFFAASKAKGLLGSPLGL